MVASLLAVVRPGGRSTSQGAAGRVHAQDGDCAAILCVCGSRRPAARHRNTRQSWRHLNVPRSTFAMIPLLEVWSRSARNVTRGLTRVAPDGGWCNHEPLLV